MNTRLEDLKKLEEKRKKKMRLVLLGALLSVDSEQELIPKLRKSSVEVLEEIKDIRKASYALADKYSDDVHRANDKDRQLIIVSAALALISHVAKRIVISEKESYASKAKDAVNNSEPMIERLVSTEIYEANMKKFIANQDKDTIFLWNAVNDKRTCSECEALDGNTYKSEEVPEYPHPNCRCVVEIVSQ